jgi:hypothetical protein
MEAEEKKYGKKYSKEYWTNKSSKLIE